MAPPHTLRLLADAYQQVQKMRIRLGNQSDAVERAVDEASLPPAVQQLAATLRDWEKATAKEMEAALEGHPAMRWLGEVHGVGPVLAGKLLAMIDIHRAQTVSQLWRHAGYAVIDGQRERPVKGRKLSYSARLKTTVYLVGTSFLKLGARSPYRAVYDAARAEYTRHRPDWTEAHRHAAAMRKMVKLFLSHLWQTWREAEGLPTRPPYAHEYLDHTTYADPWRFIGKASVPEEDAAAHQ